MTNVMFMVADEGYPDARVVAVNDQQLNNLKQRNFELSVEDEDFEDWNELIFNAANHIDLPCQVDEVCVVLLY